MSYPSYPHGKNPGQLPGNISGHPGHNPLYAKSASYIGLAKGEDTIPDRIGAVIGWRAWEVVGGNTHYHSPIKGYCLKSIIIENYWIPHQPVKAEYPGVHAFKDKRSARYYAGPNGVYGEVYLWGHICEHEKGYRAQYAYPKSLYPGEDISNSLVKDISQRYGLEEIKFRRKYRKLSSNSVFTLIIVAYIILQGLLIARVI